MNTELLACSQCHVKLKANENLLLCSNCGRQWPITDGIVRFVDNPYYWGEVPEPLMEEINTFSEEHGWRLALEKYVKAKFPNIYRYVTDAGRADFAYYVPLDKKSVVLDIGSGWGTLSCLLALRAGEVYSVESVPQRIEFLKIRSKQDDLKNVVPLQASFLELPFLEDSLDFVILNGVLEWVGIADYSESAEKLQLRVLEKIFSILKPGGYLYIGIENRFAYNYFLGAIDHSDLPYTSLMPRWLADRVMYHKTQRSRRTKQGAGSYRTYTYSYWGYRSILKRTGFSNIERYLVFPDYNHPSYLVPAANTRAFKYLIEQLYTGETKKQKSLRSAATLTAPLGFQKLFSPCFSIFAQKTT